MSKTKLKLIALFPSNTTTTPGVKIEKSGDGSQWTLSLDYDAFNLRTGYILQPTDQVALFGSGGNYIRVAATDMMEPHLYASSGSYSLTGFAATLIHPQNYTVSASQGSYVLTGMPAASDENYVLTALTTTYNLTGQIAGSLR